MNKRGRDCPPPLPSISDIYEVFYLSLSVPGLPDPTFLLIMRVVGALSL